MCFSVLQAKRETVPARSQVHVSFRFPMNGKNKGNAAEETRFRDPKKKDEAPVLPKETASI
ncbi:MAG: hypothetical protein NVSMB9_25630 [Isosphaeraceae bacterium]